MPVKPNCIETTISDIIATQDFARRIPESECQEWLGIARSINQLLVHVQDSERTLKSRLADLADARDDAQTTNLLLRRTKEELRSRSGQLDVALQKAALASSAKSQFLANMSHEIRTPMNGILGMAELLNRSPMEPKQRQQISTILHSGRALLTVINDILDFSKIESGKFELNAKPFDLHLCLFDIIELLTPAARQKSLHLELQISPDVPRHFVGDAGRIRQVVTNLAGNAVKFTDRGSVTVKLSGQIDGGKARLGIEIIDTGIGIPPEKLADVFESFSQVDQTCTRRHEGTGLGLSICTLLAGYMDGGISATSVLGEGSTFRFDLALPEHVPVREEHPAEVDLQGLRLLLVAADDESEPALTSLTRAGCDVTRVASFEGVDRIVAGKPLAEDFDIVIAMQVAISESLVNEFKAIRGGNAGCALPIIALATIGNSGDAKSLAEAGVQGYLTGPFEPTLLLRALQQIKIPGTRKLVTKHSLSETLGGRIGKIETRPVARPRNQSRVLIVDDSLVNQEVAREFLDEFGCEIEVADNGEIAVELTALQHFDLILMDCQMPVMDGYTATAAIRGRSTGVTRKDVPIIALTANAFASDREKCIGHGMNDFLSKPFLPNDFDDLVKKWLPQG